MFEIVTKYNKEIFCKCYKVSYKVFSKYNAKRNILLTIMCFVLATIAVILGITKPETFHTVFASVFFYIMTLVFILGSNIMSDKGIKRTVDKIGRVYLPTEIRQQYNLEKEIELVPTTEGVLIRNPQYVLVKKAEEK